MQVTVVQNDSCWLPLSPEDAPITPIQTVATMPSKTPIECAIRSTHRRTFFHGVAAGRMALADPRGDRRPYRRIRPPLIRCTSALKLRAFYMGGFLGRKKPSLPPALRIGQAGVRFGSKADMAPSIIDVRSYSESGHFAELRGTTLHY
jgi:hypothetical protein